MNITLKNINKQFGQFHALSSIDLHVESGELIALLGPSGSGKTTLLRIIAGLEFANGGAVYFGGEDVAATPLRKRQIGFVFQHYALFKHMTVRDNVSFGLRIRKGDARPSKSDIRQRADELLELVQLSGLGDRYPHQLSGGQRQRVALARALAIEPKVLLLDEPFGALDAKVRKELRHWLRELHQKTGVTTLFVTHDQEEALELADRVVIMSGGKIAQIGSVDEVYEQPASPMVFDFLGSTNRIPVERHGNHLVIGTDKIAIYEGDHTGHGTVYVRPGDLRVASPDDVGLDAIVRNVQRTGPIVRATVAINSTGQLVYVEMPHLHHDVQHLLPQQSLRLRLMQYSVYDAENTPDGEDAPEPVLIGRERLRLA
ncbi:sulfate/thiosulfate import ATP-binding protein CysA [Iodidimonas muriae]|uniref:Sulfate/thiosulfate import ATP-binding protein CysA n=1 Tax=Iodidimonas muriae TaxID=261467 RepID=A0ABQ2LGP8_9PROT|nr:sulfate/molybdate ABC transporter ATP-binding protein [Iodidimonas muriae]GER08759.1 sulfate/thiosulfate import ATP-binding protein CysA [Kordiimonadales bacterium JCM 17843]GGO17422.1 sulfate/thiosulfate import ATP-binding protein CysA [Iodidimonas muriae]